MNRDQKKNMKEFLDPISDEVDQIRESDLTKAEDSEDVTDSSEDLEDATDSCNEVVQQTPLETATRQAAEYLDALQRLKAEFDNFRKRMAKERQKLSELYQASVLECLLPTLDSFDAALQKSENEASSDVFKGLKMIYDNLMENLKKLDFHRMNLLNTPFDPETADAIMIQPTDQQESGVVVGEIAAGYRFKNNLLRPARVVVSAPVTPDLSGNSVAEQDHL